MNLKGLIILLLCFFPVSALYAQEQAWKDLQYICDAYTQKEAISFRATLKMYNAGKPLQIIDQLQATCLLDKNRYYTQVGPVEMIKNSHCLLIVDHDDKLVVISDAGGQGPQQKQQAAFMAIGEMLQGMKEGGVRVQKVMRGNETWLEIAELPDPAMQRCNIQYDPHTFLLKRLWIKSLDAATGNTEPVIVDITYHYGDKTPGADHLEEAKFVRVQGKQAALQPAYQHYTLINQL